MPRKRRDAHALDADGAVVCNPRDLEAAHRAEIGDLATAASDAVTCAKCVSLRRAPAPPEIAAALRNRTT